MNTADDIAAGIDPRWYVRRKLETGEEFLKEHKELLEGILALLSDTQHLRSNTESDPYKGRYKEKLSKTQKNGLIQKHEDLLRLIDCHMERHLFPNSVEELIDLYLRLAQFLAREKFDYTFQYDRLHSELIDRLKYVLLRSENREPMH
jgi:hypothetical protein